MNPMNQPDKIELEKYLIDKLMALVSETRIPAEMPDELIYFTVLYYERDILAKTVSILKAQEQERVEEIFKKIDNLIDTYSYGDGSFISFQDGLQVLKKEEIDG